MVPSRQDDGNSRAPALACKVALVVVAVVTGGGSFVVSHCLVSSNMEKKKKRGCWDRGGLGGVGEQNCFDTSIHLNIIAVYLLCVLCAKYDLLLDTKGLCNISCGSVRP